MTDRAVVIPCLTLLRGCVVILVGVVVAWFSGRVLVRLDSGVTISARTNGRRYIGIGARVYVAVAKGDDMAVVI